MIVDLLGRGVIPDFVATLGLPLKHDAKRAQSLCELPRRSRGHRQDVFGQLGARDGAAPRT